MKSSFFSRPLQYPLVFSRPFQSRSEQGGDNHAILNHYLKYIKLECLHTKKLEEMVLLCSDAQAKGKDNTYRLSLNFCCR